jgi:hypothetical protein
MKFLCRDCIAEIKEELENGKNETEDEKES